MSPNCTSQQVVLLSCKCPLSVIHLSHLCTVLLWMVDPRFLNSSSFTTSTPCIFSFSPPLLLFTHVFCLVLTCSDFHPSTSPGFLPLAPTTDYNVICKHHGPRKNSCLTSSINVSVIIANKKGLILDVIPSLTLNPSVTLDAHLTTVLLSFYMPYTTLTYFSDTPDVIIQYHSSSHDTLSYAVSWSTKTQLQPPWPSLYFSATSLSLCSYYSPVH